MKIIDVLIVAIILLVVGGAAFYVYKAKKNGQACIGCPHSKECGGKKCTCAKE